MSICKKSTPSDSSAIPITDTMICSNQPDQCLISPNLTLKYTEQHADQESKLLKKETSLNIHSPVQSSKDNRKFK